MNALYNADCQLQSYLSERQQTLVPVGELSNLGGESHIRTGVHQVLSLVCKLVNDGLVGQDLLALFLEHGNKKK